MGNEDWFVIGEIASNQGNKGEVRVVMYTDFPQRFAAMKQVHLFRPEATMPEFQLVVENSRMHKQFVVLKLAGVDSINDAQKLKGMLLKVQRHELYPLPKDRHYVFDIIGLSVQTTAGEELGSVEDVLKTGANDVYVVGTGKQQLLIPAIDQVVLAIDTDNGRMLVALPAGLRDE